MPKLSSLFGALLVLTSAHLWAMEEPYAVPLEVGQRVEITLARPYRTIEGVRVQATSVRMADKDLLTLAAGGQEKTLPRLAGRGRVQGLLTAVDDAWLTLDLGEQRPLLRIPRVAIVRWAAAAPPEPRVPDHAYSFDGFTTSLASIRTLGVGATLRTSPDRSLSFDAEGTALLSSGPPVVMGQAALRLTLAPRAPVTPFMTVGAALLSSHMTLPLFFSETGIRVEPALHGRTRLFVEPAYVFLPIEGGLLRFWRIKVGVSTRP
jgi:hypothetical protein